MQCLIESCEIKYEVCYLKTINKVACETKIRIHLNWK